MTLFDAGAWASIIGMLITIYVLKSITTIKRHYQAKARMPQLVEDISEGASALAKLHGSYESSQPDIALQLAKLKPVIKALRRKVDANTWRLAKSVIRSMNTNPSRDTLWHLYLQIQELLVQLREGQRDRSWER